MPTLTTCPDVRVLERLLLGQISAADAVPLEQHVNDCSQCADMLHQIHVDDLLVDALRHTPALSGLEQTPFVQALIPCLKRLRPSDAQQTSSEETQTKERREPTESVEQFDFLAPAQADDELGRLGSYRVLKLLGTGGMGIVFLAADPRLRRRIALKVIKPELMKNSEVRERFLREAQSVARVEHENIVTIFQVDEDRGVPFLAMPWLHGEALEERIKRSRGPLPLDETLRLGREIASGLAAAHDHGLVHRDIKPGNIFLSRVPCPSSSDDSATLNLLQTLSATTATEKWTEHGQVKVKILDFGLARAVRGGDSNLSQQGQILGTPSYMAPEQGRGRAVDHRADLFSLGCVLYRMATGRLAFRGRDYVGLLLSVAMDTPTPARELNPDVPPALARLIDQLLAKNPEERPSSAHAVVEALAALERARTEAQRPKRSRRGLLIGTAAVLVASGLAAGLAWWTTPPPVPPPEKPGEVTFAFDEPNVQLVLQREQEPEIIVDPKDAPKRTLPPGRYRIRPAIAKEGRQLIPDEVVVKAGEAQTLALRLVGQIRKVGGFDFAVTGVAVSSKKGVPTILASSHDQNAVLGVWDGQSEILTFPSDTYQQMECVAFAPDAAHAVTAGGNRQKPDTSIYVWDVHQPRPKLLQRLPGHTVFVKSLAYSPNGTRLLSGDAQGKVFLWNLDKLGERTEWEGHKASVYSVAFSADGKRALTGGRDQVVLLWDVEKGKASRGLEHLDTVQVHSVAFGPGANEATTAGSDGLIRIWDLKSGKSRDLKGHKGGVTSVAVSPDGKRLLSGGADGTLRLWDAKTGRELYLFKSGDQAINSVAFTAEGRRALSGGADRALRLWELPP